MTAPYSKNLTSTQQAKADDLASRLRFLRAEMDELGFLPQLEGEHDRIHTELTELTGNPDYAY